MYFLPFTKQTKLKFDLNSLIGFKILIKFKDFMPWVMLCNVGNFSLRRYYP